MEVSNKIYSGLTNRKVYLFRFVFIMLFIAAGLIVYLFYTTPLDIFYKLLYVLTTLTFFVYLGPLLILYFNYSRENKTVVFEIKNDTLIFKKDASEDVFTIEDIDFVEFNFSVPLYNKQLRLFFWDEYYYAKIKLVNEDVFYITCLLCDDIEGFIPEILIKRRRRVFPLIQYKQEVKSDYKRIQEDVQSEEKVQRFIIKFKDKSQIELQHIIKNPSQYQKEAVEAALHIIQTK